MSKSKRKPKKGWKRFLRNKVYYFQEGRGRIRSGHYTGLFWNKEMKCFAYNFTGLEKFVYYTLYITPKTRVWRLS